GGVVVTAALDHWLCDPAVVGHQRGQRNSECLRDLEFSSSGLAQYDQQSCAGRAGADKGSGCVLLHLAVLHRLRHVDRRYNLGLADGLYTSPACEGVWRDDPYLRLFAHHHFCDACDWHADAPVRDRRYPRSRLRWDRDTLPVLRHPARVVRRGADGFGYRLKHPIRQPAEDHIATTGLVADPDGGCQLFGGWDGQEDRCTIDCRRINRDQLVRT